MATFTANATVGVDMIDLFFHWAEGGNPIDNIDIFNLNPQSGDVFDNDADLQVRYSSPGNDLTKDGTNKIPTGGTFTSITAFTDTGGPVVTRGTLTGITNTDNFKDVDDHAAYHVLDGADSIIGSSAGDTLFSGFGGNDIYTGGGGDDFFYVSARALAPLHTITGGTGFDTIRTFANLYDNSTTLDLRNSALEKIDAIVMAGFDPITVEVNSTQFGADLLSFSASISGALGIGRFHVFKDNGGVLDLTGLTVTSAVVEIDGTNLADTILGTGVEDTFRGGDGADSLNGNGGNDIFEVGALDAEFDAMNGGIGNDAVRPVGSIFTVLNNFNATALSIEMWDGNGGSLQGNANANTFDLSGLTSVTNLFFISAGEGVDTVKGSNFADRIGVNGADAEFDTMRGGGGSDSLLVLGADRAVLNGFNAASQSIEKWEGNGHGLRGNGGANVFDLSGLTAMSGLTSIGGGAGIDTITGSKFADAFAVEGSEAEFDTMKGGLGTDTLRIDGGHDVTLNGFNAAAQSIEKVEGAGLGILGNANANVFDLAGIASSNLLLVDGQAGNDTMTGSPFGEILLGGDGNEAMDGGAGDDQLSGDLGADQMTGGLGADQFDFAASDEIGKKKALHDIITDFTTGEDLINLSAIDANGSKKGDKAFKFVKHEGAAFTGKAGQLVFDQKGSKGVTFVKGDIDGNGRPDFKLELTGLIDLNKADFVL